MKQIKKDLNTLRDQDLINIILYGLYKITEDPEYSAISELIYILDKDNLFKLCSAFGGCTIKIPTLQELSDLTKTLLVYQYVNGEGKSFAQALKEAGIEGDQKKKVFNMYNILSEVISEYEQNQ